MPMSAVANDGDSYIHDKGSDTVEKSSLWLKAYDAAAPDTRRWIESVPDSTISQDNDKGDQLWIEELVKIVRGLEKKHQDSSLRITVGQRDVVLRDYVAPAMTWFTMIGDIATQFVPAPSGIAWSAIKVLLQVCRS